jgi:hypothetical protein
MIPYPVKEKLLGHCFYFYVNKDNPKMIASPDAFDIEDFMRHFCQYYENEAEDKTENRDGKVWKSAYTQLQSVNRTNVLITIYNTLNNFKAIQSTREEAQP